MKKVDYDEKLQKIAELLKKVRLEKEITLTTLEDRHDLNRSSIKRFEDNVGVINLRTFLKLTDALEINPNEVLKSHLTEVDELLLSLRSKLFEDPKNIELLKILVTKM